MITLEERRERLELALTLAAAAEAEIRPRFGRCEIRHKPDGSVVTEADVRAEEAIRGLLQRHAPGDSILSEEFGSDVPLAKDSQWIVDPLDGTAWFALGVPSFGTLVAYVDDGRPVLGVIHFPMTGDTVYAAHGLGCSFRGKNTDSMTLRVRACSALGEAVASASGVHGTNLVVRQAGHPRYDLRSLVRLSGQFRFAGDCLQHALVCRGLVDVAVDTIMKPWDVAAIIPCVEEAGGAVGSLEENQQDLLSSRSLISAGNRAVLIHARRVLRGSVVGGVVPGGSCTV